MRRVAILLLVGLLLALPAASAQKLVDKCSQQCLAQDADVNDPALRSEGPVNVVLYAHIEDILNMMPMNTALPDPVREPDINRGFFMPVVDTNTGVCPTSATCADFHFKNNEFNLYFCPGLILFLQEGWFLGCMSPVYADTVPLGPGPLVLYWYVSARPSPPGAVTSAPASVMPGVFVSASLIERVNERATTPTVYAQGLSATATLLTLPGQDPVYEFRVEIKPTTAMLDDGGGEPALGPRPYLLRVTVDQLRGPTDSTVAQPDWRLRSGPLFMPRLVLPVMEPIVPGVATTSYDGSLYIRASLRPALGSYDLNKDSVSLRLVGPAGPVDYPSGAVSMVEIKRSTDHDGVLKPVLVTWRIDPKALGVGDASYHWEIRGTNLQGTYESVQEIPFSIPSFQGDANLPAPGLLAIAFAAVGAVFLLRRRAT